MKAVEPKDARVDFRLTTEQKEIIARAAAVAGLSLSDFISSAMMKASRDVLESRLQMVSLPLDAWDRFVEAIQSEGRDPTEAAAKAAAKYRKGRVSADTYHW